MTTRAQRPGRRRAARTLVAALFGATLLGIAGCSDLPRDPDGTLERARGGVLRVGVTEGAVAPELELVRGFAASIGARVEWVRGGADRHLAMLERRQLDVVAAGLTADSPWKSRVALTRPWAEERGRQRVLATAPGENALLVALEHHIRAGR